MDVAPGIMSSDASESHFLNFYIDEMIRLSSRFEGSGFTQLFWLFTSPLLSLMGQIAWGTADQ